ncbi:SusC/RagA family TonB-linked outer membrane protein [Dyadobacter luticola]|uniref:SusC/RagA family TonB-linked outer membrane protein n=1 Tax=Dyadobacter luticola TaxID=1979387 RepID=A0A5R9KT35_9BACT|nr:SusC/RagA family TonB-linked outer membrane protein [Dyadobacter luticola]TLU99452.1 SusC/RagA family TonB-linked outer membrane protein [Dyadobacter luticola]
MMRALPERSSHCFNRHWERLVLVVFLFFQAGFCMAWPGSGCSIEEVRITIYLKDVSLQKAFIAIEKKSDFRFITSIERINTKKKVSVSLQNTSVKDVLENILAGTGLGYTQINNNIIINNKTAVVRQAAASVMPAQVTTETAPLEVKGSVKDAKGSGVPGTNISIKGTSQGTTTDLEGRFALNVPDENAVLIFSSIGYITQEVTVNGRSAIDLMLLDDVKQLSEVVVTALGIEKDAKSVTYAQQNVGGEELIRVKDPNMINSLAGKAAGVVITKGTGGPGSSSRILLRGNKSITGNNQPLYVIDGIPMNNANGTQGNSLFDTRDAGDAISNLNPEDIENLSILKGASAAALYGSQAANGVILITTKKGRKGFASVNFSSNASFENPIALPHVQTKYGQGYGGVSNTAVNDSWGPAITNGSDKHLKSFFDTGRTFVNSISVTNGNDIGQFYLSYANTKANGIVPQNDYKRHNINLRGTTTLFKNKLSLDASVNYVEQKVYNRPMAGFYFSPIFSLYLFPTGDDFSKYSGSNFEKWDPSRLMNVQNWPYIKNEASSNQNPYWLANRNQTDQFRNRTIYAFSAKWKLTDWLSLQGRATYDKVQDSYELRQYASSDPTLVGINGGYRKNLTNTDQLYSDILLSGTKTLGKDFFASATLGFSNTQNTFYDLNVGNSGATNTLSFPNFFSAYALQSLNGQGFFNATESLQKRLSQALFATATVGYKETYFLDLTARKEWSSTVNQSFFYPSVGLSYVLTEHLNPNEILSFAKLRGSYAEVGNALPFGVSNWSPPYALSNDENVIGRGTLPFFSGSDTTSLKPERTRSWEFGTELRFFKDKLNVNLTYYNATTFDQVFQIQAPAGAGAANFWINGGTIRNKGFEGTISYKADFGGVTWTPGVNFSRNVNQIRELSSLLKSDWFVLQAGGSTRMLQLFLTRPGIANLGGRAYGSYGDLFGKTYQRDENGHIKYNETTGLPLLSSGTDQYLGNANPKFLMGFNNQFKYKNATLSFLVDGRFGGKIASMTEQWLDFKGLSKRSGDARDAGGVTVNGKTIPAETYYNYISGKGDVAAAAEEYMFSATNVRMRELALSYSLPKFSKAIKDITVSFISRNLFFFYKDAPFDPEVSITTANGMQGIEGFSIPATRSYGFTVRATF